jgi:methionine synthase I (cobalamin-dependent)
MTLERIHGAYNHDGSEVQTDYFDVHYYGQVGFQDARSARFEAEEKARKAARRAAIDAATERRKVTVFGRQGSTTHLAAEVEGKLRLVCGATLWRSSLVSAASDDAAVSCSRCARREA